MQDMVAENETHPGRPLLYHAPSSYYSMIARLALHERAIDFAPVFMDIHRRMTQFRPDYVRLNPHMTVPTMALPDRVLIESRDIALFAFGLDETALDDETRRWLDLHYSFPIEELTIGGMMRGNPLARYVIPRRLAMVERRLRALAAANADLAKAYEARAAVFAQRVRTFDPDAALQLSVRRRQDAKGLLDELKACLGDGRAVLVPPDYGVADVVWTVFLARIEFAGLGEEISRRPALARYWAAMQARPNYGASDVWTRMHRARWIAGMLGLVIG